MGTKYKGSSDDILSLNTFICLARAADSINNRLNSRISSYNLTISQFGILEALYHMGSMCQKQLSDKILKSTANITTVIDNLEKRALVKRIRQETDRRYITVELTEKGKKLIQDIFPEHVKYINEELSILSAEEKLKLKTLCKIVGKKEREQATS
ncbi:MAG: MarR family transcriptional regulator [Leptospiraceae bacterium]|nr:MarR family transcriptional regulator [Leptospiraceae bacterium]